jgi:hypothetical protein
MINFIVNVEMNEQRKSGCRISDNTIICCLGKGTDGIMIEITHVSHSHDGITEE